MARKKEIDIGESKDGVIEIKLAHWKHFPKLITNNLLNYPGYIFRGQASAKWKLESSFDRLVNKTGSKKTLKSHLNAFKNASLGRRGKTPQELKNDDEWWAIGQHNGLATPFLDFTRSAFVALYFAFCDTSFNEKNRIVYGLQFYRIMRALKEKYKADDDEKNKVKIFYPSSDENDRLINQSGLFIKLPNKKTLEEIVKEVSNEKDTKGDLLRIIIPNTDKRDCLTMLNKMNINHSTLFPDLYGAAKYINYLHDIPDYDNIELYNL